MGFFLVFTTINLNKHVQHTVNSIGSANAPLEAINLQLKSRRTMGFTVFVFVLNCLANINVFMGSTHVFAPSMTSNTFAKVFLISGEFLQVVSGMAMFVSAITMHKCVAMSRQVIMDNAMSGSQTVHTNVTIADVIMLEVRATSAVNITNAVYLLIFNAVLPVFGLLAPFANFSSTALGLGFFIAYPALPLLQAIAVLVMIIVFNVMSAEPSEKKNAEAMQNATVNDVQPIGTY